MASNRGSIHRWLILLFPWFAMRRIRMLASNETPPELQDEWDRGYDRAWYEVRLNPGMEDAP